MFYRCLSGNKGVSCSPVTGSVPGSVPSLVPGLSGGGVPLSCLDRTVGTPQTGWGTLLTGQGVPLPQTGEGITPPGQVILWVVRLLKSRRKIFLLKLLSLSALATHTCSMSQMNIIQLFLLQSYYISLFYCGQDGRPETTTASWKHLYYRSSPVNSNTVNSKFHLTQTFCKIFATFLSIQC